MDKPIAGCVVQASAAFVRVRITGGCVAIARAWYALAQPFVSSRILIDTHISKVAGLTGQAGIADGAFALFHQANTHATHYASGG